MKKIGILTLHYSNNYGGLLQVYSLLHFLKSKGYDPIILNRMPRRNRTLLLRLLKPFFDFFFAKNFKKFQYEYLNPKTREALSSDELSNIIDEENIDAVIVGSDQVWRLDYTTVGLDYFLGIPNKVRRLSYAASFGLSYWKYEKEIPVISDLLLSFEHISVREKSAVQICANTFSQFNVQHVLDPTMLFDKFFYEKYLISSFKVKFSGKICVYFLDKTKNKLAYVKTTSSILNSHYIDLYAHLSLSDIRHSLMNLMHCLNNPSVFEWLSSIYYSQYVITDSFHGLVFAILFQKPFVVIGNSDRGMDRFTSLLDLLSLQSHLIEEKDLINRPTLIESIDYKGVNLKLEQLRMISRQYLLNSLG